MARETRARPCRDRGARGAYNVMREHVPVPLARQTLDRDMYITLRATLFNPGADRDTSADRDMLGSEVRPIDDESGVPAGQVELSDEGDRLRRG